MVDTLPRTGDPLAPRETRLSDDISSYIVELTRRAPGTISFRTGSGRLLRDLLIHWPTLDGWEAQAQALCNRIVDAIFPLAGVMYAQAVEVAVNISPRPIEPPKRVDALETYAVFDAQSGFEKLYYLRPNEKLPDLNAMRAVGGVAVVGRPLNVFYHTLKDDRRKFAHVRKGMYELPQSMINALYEEPAFISSDYEKKVRESLRKTVEELPARVERFEQRREAAFTPRRRRAPEAAAAFAAVPAVTALSALPPPVRAAEHRLMGYALDRDLSPEFRLRVRRAAQSLRDLYPQATLAERARAELAPSVTAPRTPRLQPAMSVPAMAPTPATPGTLPTATLGAPPPSSTASPSPTTSPIVSPFGAPTAAPAATPVSGPASPALQARRVSAAEQLNQPQLSVEGPGAAEPDRPGATRAGLQPEARVVETPRYPVPPTVIPRPPPEPRLPDVRPPDVPGATSRPPEERAEVDRRFERQRELLREPVPASERSLSAMLEREPRPEMGLGLRAIKLPREPAYGIERRLSPAPEVREPVGLRRELTANIAGYVPIVRNESRPANAYKMLRPSPESFPRMTAPENSGRLQKTMQVQLTQQMRSEPRIQPWMFPSPSPTPYPRAVRLRGK